MSNQEYVFNKTVIGYRHIKEEIPCEDASISYFDSSGFSIIAVADGHGDPSCSRSEIGSQFAVDIARSCMKDFAIEFQNNNIDFESRRAQNECIKQLTDSIISKWYERVEEDLLENSLSDEEIKNSGDYKNDYLNGIKLEHLYGTTLIAALKIQKYLILIQQGDGRCDVIYEDGTINQPIPWDDRCSGSTTTSMCNSDVVNSIRHSVLNINEAPVIACYLGSDGVEDSYHDNEINQLGTHRFYMDLTRRLIEMGLENFENHLEEYLLEFSKKGSGDDVSIAGIVSVSKIEELHSLFVSEVDKYDYNQVLSLKLEESKNKYISMTRKHGILCEKVLSYEKQLNDKKDTLLSIEKNINKLKIDVDHLEKEYTLLVKDLEEYKKETSQAEQLIDGKYNLISNVIHTFITELSTNLTKKEDKCLTLKSKIEELYNEIEDEEKKLNEEKNIYDEIEKNYQQYKLDYEEYDNKYLGLKRNIDDLEQKILDVDTESV